MTDLTPSEVQFLRQMIPVLKRYRGKVGVIPPLTLVEGIDGQKVGVDANALGNSIRTPFIAELTATSGGAWTWAEREQTAAGTWADGDRSGTLDAYPAEASAGTPPTPAVNDLVWMRASPTLGGKWEFVPLETGGGSTYSLQTVNSDASSDEPSTIKIIGDLTSGSQFSTGTPADGITTHVLRTATDTQRGTISTIAQTITGPKTLNRTSGSDPYWETVVPAATVSSTAYTPYTRSGISSAFSSPVPYSGHHALSSKVTSGVTTSLRAELYSASTANLHLESTISGDGNSYSFDVVVDSLNSSAGGISAIWLAGSAQIQINTVPVGATSILGTSGQVSSIIGACGGGSGFATIQFSNDTVAGALGGTSEIVTVHGSLILAGNSAEPRYGVTRSSSPYVLHLGIDDSFAASGYTWTIKGGIITAKTGATSPPVGGSPTFSTGTTNNWAKPTGKDLVYIDASTPATITGIVAGYDGEKVMLIVTGTETITFQHQDTGSTAANRIITATGANVTYIADEGLWIVYDATTARWRIPM